MATEDQGLRWQASSVACVATYNVLEHADKMDEFEDVDTPFSAAGKLTVAELRFWPGVDVPAGGLELLAQLKAREFLTFVAKNFSAKKRDPKFTSAAVLREAAKLFGNGKTTLRDIAALLDGRFRF